MECVLFVCVPQCLARGLAHSRHWMHVELMNVCTGVDWEEGAKRRCPPLLQAAGMRVCPGADEQLPVVQRMELPLEAGRVKE